MKIAIVDPSLFTIPYDSELAFALGTRGAKVTLYGRPLRRGEKVSRPVKLSRHFYVVSDRAPGPLRRVAKGIEHALDMAAFCGRMALVRPDVVHFQWCPLPVIDRPTLSLLRRSHPLVMTVHDPVPYNGTDHGIMNHGAREIWDCFDLLIVHSEAGCEELARSGVDLSRVRVIPHGPLSPLISGVRGIISPPGKLNIVFFGTVKPYKGLLYLISALAQLSQKEKDQLHLVVAGEAVMDVAELEELARVNRVSVTWDLRFIPDDEVGDYLGQSDLFVFPYTDIDASGVLMSCLGCGKPIIASNIGTFSQLLIDGVHGHLVEPRDVRALVVAIQRVLENPDEARRMGEAVRKLLDEIPRWPDIAERTMDAYGAAIEARKMRP